MYVCNVNVYEVKIFWKNYFMRPMRNAKHLLENDQMGIPSIALQVVSTSTRAEGGGFGLHLIGRESGENPARRDPAM